MPVFLPYCELKDAAKIPDILSRGGSRSRISGKGLRLKRGTLVLVQPMKIRPYITERLLMGRKESNQTGRSNYDSSLSQILLCFDQYCYPGKFWGELKSRFLTKLVASV